MRVQLAELRIRRRLSNAVAAYMFAIRSGVIGVT